MNIGMYTDKEIYDTLANGMLQRSMVDAMVFGIKDLQQELDQYKNNWEELKKCLIEESKFDEYKDITYRETMGYVLDKMKELEKNN